MRESDTQASGSKLDRMGIEGDEFILEQERFTGNELDEELDEKTESVPIDEGALSAGRGHKASAGY
jgi:hypothetical protein